MWINQGLKLYLVSSFPLFALPIEGTHLLWPPGREKNLTKNPDGAFRPWTPVEGCILLWIFLHFTKSDQPHKNEHPLFQHWQGSASHGQSSLLHRGIFLPLIKRFHKTKIKLKCGNSMNHSLLMCVFFRFRCRTSLPISTHNMPDTRYLTNTRPNVDHDRKYPKMAVINKLCIRTRRLFKFQPYSQSKWQYMPEGNYQL